MICFITNLLLIWLYSLQRNWINNISELGAALATNTALTNLELAFLFLKEAILKFEMGFLVLAPTKSVTFQFWKLA